MYIPHHQLDQARKDLRVLMAEDARRNLLADADRLADIAIDELATLLLADLVSCLRGEIDADLLINRLRAAVMAHAVAEEPSYWDVKAYAIAQVEANA